MTCGLILAAGESRRMGSPKALLDFHGETFLDRLIFLFSARCYPVVVAVPFEGGQDIGGIEFDTGARSHRHEQHRQQPFDISVHVMHGQCEQNPLVRR